MKKKNSNKHEIRIDKKTFYNKKTHKFEQLDNKVIKTKKGFKNKNGLFNVCFNNLEDDNDSLVIEKDNYKIEMKLLGKKEGNHILLKNKKFIKENDYKVVCKDVFEDEDIDFEIVNNKTIKENIIIKNNNKSSYKYEYLFKMRNLKLKNDGSNLSFVNENNEVIFEILPLVMIDSVGSKSNEINYIINIQNSNTFLLKIDADSNWINSQERVLPIYLDPSFLVSADNECFSSYQGTIQAPEEDEDAYECVGSLGEIHYTTNDKYIIKVNLNKLYFNNPNIINIELVLILPYKTDERNPIVQEHFGEKDYCNLKNIEVFLEEISDIGDGYSMYKAVITDSLLINESYCFDVSMLGGIVLKDAYLRIFYREKPGEKKTIQLTKNLKCIYDYSLKKCNLLLDVPNNIFNLSFPISFIGGGAYFNKNYEFYPTYINNNYDYYIEKKGEDLYIVDGMDDVLKINLKETKETYSTSSTIGEGEETNINIKKYFYLGDDQHNILKLETTSDNSINKIVVENKTTKNIFTLSELDNNKFYLNAIIDKSSNKLTLIKRYSYETYITTPIKEIHIYEYNENSEANGFTDNVMENIELYESIYFKCLECGRHKKIYKLVDGHEIDLVTIEYGNYIDTVLPINSITMYDEITKDVIDHYQFNNNFNDETCTILCLDGHEIRLSNYCKTIESRNKYSNISNSSLTENNDEQYDTIMKIEYSSLNQLFVTDKYGNKESLLLDVEGNMASSFVYKNSSKENNIKTFDNVVYNFTSNNKENNGYVGIYGNINIKNNNHTLNYTNIANIEELEDFICDDIKFNNQSVFKLRTGSSITLNINISNLKNLDNSNYLIGFFVKKKYFDFPNFYINDAVLYDIFEPQTEDLHFLVLENAFKPYLIQGDTLPITIEHFSFAPSNYLYLSCPIIKKMDNEKIVRFSQNEKKEEVENPPVEGYNYKITYDYTLTQTGKDDIVVNYDENKNAILQEEISTNLKKTISYQYKTIEDSNTNGVPLFEIDTSTTTITSVDGNDKVYSVVKSTYNSNSTSNTVNYLELERISSDLLENNMINITESVSYNNSIDKLSNTIINNNSNKSISTSKSLDAFKNVLTETNELGETYITNTYNHINNIKSMSLSNLATKSYSYNNLLLTEINAFENENTSINNTFEYTEGLLTKVSFNNNINYLYSYDKNKCLSKFEMKINNNLISAQNFNYKDDCVYNDDTIVDNYNYFEISYGNYKAKEIYDENDNVILFKEKKDENSSYEISKEYVYNECNNLVETTEKIGNNVLTTAYLYENDDNVISKIMHAGVFSYNISYQEYDKTNFTQKTTYSFNNGNKTNEYIYEYSRFDGSVCAVTNPLGNFSIKRDGYLRRKLFTTTVSDDISVTKTFNYYSTDTQDTNIINSVSHKTNFSGGSATLCNESYEYDAKGNITKQVLFGKPIYYTYDKFNRLVREDNKLLDVSKFYRYDNNNNVTLTGTGIYTHNDGDMYASNTKTFTYNTYNQLMKAENTDGTYIEFGTNYDENGNPLLVSKNEVCVSGSEVQTQYSNLIFSRYNTLIAYGNINFEYDCNGNRVSKKYGNITHLYYINNNTIHREDIIDAALDEVVSIYYYYDLNGLCGFEYNNNKYYYIKDLTGNIIGIYNSNGGLVARYAYDAWGNHKVLNANGTENNNELFIGNINPFRYKGYYYDVETGLFWLSSRYYSPELCRFISPDDVGYLEPESINGLNLYAYAKNNPIMYYDPSGHSALLVFASVMFLGIMGAASSIAVQAISDIATGNKFDIVNYLIAGGTGFIGGALSYINPYLGAAVQGALSTGLSMGYAEYKGKADYDWIDYTIAITGSVGMSLLTTWGFGKIVNKTNAFETARIFGDNLSYWFDCGNKVFFEMLGDLTPYYLAYSLANAGSGLLGGWIPEYAREVIGLKRLGLSWGDSLKYAF